MVLQLLEDLASQRLDSWSLTKCFCCLVASPLIMMNRVTLWPQGQLFVSDEEEKTIRSLDTPYKGFHTTLSQMILMRSRIRTRKGFNLLPKHAVKWGLNDVVQALINFFLTILFETLSGQASELNL